MAPTRGDMEKHIPAGDAEFDVIVCGSGMAGLGAAFAAAAQGARTLARLSWTPARAMSMAMRRVPKPWA